MTSYKVLLAMRGAHRRPRMTYLDGAVELMTMSKPHERLRYLFGRLLERYLMALGVTYLAYGETTFQCPERAGLEADECYVLGPARDDRPDLAIEVVWTRGGVEKLEVYATLGVPEVWMWIRGAIRIYELTERGYVERTRSALLPQVDHALLLAFLDRPASIETLIAFDRALAMRDLP
jgi:Uma2 family endonuclease